MCKYAQLIHIKLLYFISKKVAQNTPVSREHVRIVPCLNRNIERNRNISANNLYLSPWSMFFNSDFTQTYQRQFARSILRIFTFGAIHSLMFLFCWAWVDFYILRMQFLSNINLCSALNVPNENIKYFWLAKSNVPT